MPHYKLRRCDICGKYHASYIVTDPETGKKTRICTSCWKAQFASQPPKDPPRKIELPEKPDQKN